MSTIVTISSETIEHSDGRAKRTIVVAIDGPLYDRLEEAIESGGDGDSSIAWSQDVTFGDGAQMTVAVASGDPAAYFDATLWVEGKRMDIEPSQVLGGEVEFQDGLGKSWVVVVNRREAAVPA